MASSWALTGAASSAAPRTARSRFITTSLRRLEVARCGLLLGFLELLQLDLDLGAADIEHLLDHADLGGKVVGDADVLALDLQARPGHRHGVVGLFAHLEALLLAG